MALNVNFSPLDFRELNLRKPTGADDFVEGLGYIKEGKERRRRNAIEDERLATEKAERERKQAADAELAKMLNDDGNIDAQIVDIENKIAELENQNRELMKGR